jgi:lipoate-protein ligase A
VERAVGSAGEFHARDLPLPPRRRVQVLEVDRPALVLGSTQPAAHVDAAAAAAAGIEVVRRRSGGGAVLLEPGGAVWVDVVVPPGDPLWHDDVGRAAHWLGDAWVAALAGLGVAARAHHGGLVRTPWSDRVCFAGLGPGEVQVAGRKVVGISQRRTRAGARFQCAALRSWDAATVVGLLALTAEERAAAGADLQDVACGLDVPGPALVAALLDALP